LFNAGGSEALDDQIYWSSSGYEPSTTSNDYAYYQTFNTGQQGPIFKDLTYRVRAVRRVALPNNTMNFLSMYYQSSGILYKSNNGGDSWETYSTIPSGYIVNFLFKNLKSEKRNTWYAIGETLPFNVTNILYVSNDAGVTWSAKTLPSSARWRSGIAIDNTIYLTAGAVVIRSFDGGDSWPAYTPPFPITTAPSFGFITESSKMIAITADGVWVSTDYINWTNFGYVNGLTTGDSYTPLIKAGTIYVIIGVSGNYMYSTNFGQNWTAITNAPTNSLDWRAVASLGDQIMQINYPGPSFTNNTSRISTNSGITFTLSTMPATATWWTIVSDGRNILVSDLAGTTSYRSSSISPASWTAVSRSFGYGPKIWVL
jgi:photosystem II stability/assembly factor-like uncharacterized protein